MRYLFLLNPTAGKRDCTAELAPAIQAAARTALDGRLCRGRHDRGAGDADGGCRLKNSCICSGFPL
ncbi:MAG: hypothetical protein ACLTMO_09465 [Faecalibacterium prausnitzii]